MRQSDRAAVDLQAQLGGETGGAQQTQRVAAEALCADRAQDLGLEVGETAEGIDRLAAGERQGHGSDREITCGQVRFDPLAAQRRRVDLPASTRSDDAPGAELDRELEGVLAELARDRLGRRARVAGHREVEVGDVLSQGGVADRSPDNPDAIVVAQGPPRGRNEGRSGETLSQAHAGCRGTRAEIPQVTS